MVAIAFGAAGPPLELARPAPAFASLSTVARWTAFLLALAVIGSSGCPGGSGPRRTDTLPLVTTDDPEAEADLRAAREAMANGDDGVASDRYTRFLREHPEDALAPIAHLGLGQLALADGHIEAARRHFAVVAAHPDQTVAERGRFYDGVALHLQGDHRGAIERLLPLRGRTVDPEQTELLYATLAAASAALGDHAAEIEYLDEMLRAAVPEDKKRDARHRIGEVVANEATADEIQRAADHLPRDGEAWPLIMVRAVRDASAAGNMPRVRLLIASLREAGTPLDPEISALAVRSDRTDTADRRSIGAILPLSGRGQEVGQRALRGLMLATGTPSDGPTAPGALQLHFRDDGGDPERAARAVDDLVSMHRVVASIGPLDRATAERAAVRAEELGVPLIALTPSASIVEHGPMVFQLFVEPEAEVAALIETARRRGATRASILHPASPYGISLRDAFVRTAQTHGLAVVGVESYGVGTTGFMEKATALARLEPDFVFVPDAARPLSLIAPALAAAGLHCAPAGASLPRGARRIQIAAPSVGFDPALLAPSRRYLQGALFSAPFFAPSAEGAGRHFTDAFQSEYAQVPDVFAAYAYDAALLVQRALAAGALTRGEVRSQLERTAGADTAGASSGLTAARTPSAGTRILELRGETFLPVAAGRSSSDP